MQKRLKGFGGLVLITAIGGVGLAAPGDIYRVTAHRANLRAGRSQSTVVSTQLRRGDPLIELERSGKWLGARDLVNGDEGWTYNALVDLVSPSRLDRSTAAPRFRDLSEGFDGMLQGIDERLRYCATEIQRVRKECG